jgi:hypothetical protein|tara:strand:+ start:7919 stop:8635 length:717 start_codon:yes stop_codon:yes gene_type:complete
MTLLTICQNVADFTGFERPTTVIDNTDPIARQLLALAKREGTQLMRATAWPILLKEHTFSTSSGTAAYALPADFDRLVNETVYNRSDNDIFSGPLTPAEYQLQNYGTASSGTTEKFRLKAASNALKFEIDPTPSSTQTIGFEYVSSYYSQSSGGTGQAAWAADTDTGILDESLFELGLTFRFKQAHGLSYDQDYREYQLELRQAISRQGSSPILSMDDARRLIVSPYSYNLNDGNYGT